MKVFKFGGTSMGTAKSIIQVKNIITKSKEKKVVVCSAMSGVTNQLYELTDALKDKNKPKCVFILSEIEDHHHQTAGKLITNKNQAHTVKRNISNVIQDLEHLISLGYSLDNKAQIVTYGELLSTVLFSGYLKASGYDNTLLTAKDFIEIDNFKNPNAKKIEANLKQLLSNSKTTNLYITQGFSCKTSSGKIWNLGRGGSDLTSTLIAEALSVEEVQIWTDIDGVHNNDPRYVEGTTPVPVLTYHEASNLAYFGAKVLHPSTVKPLIEKEIPLLLKNTFVPEACGTKITKTDASNTGIKAIASKENITWVKIKNIKLNKGDELFTKAFEVLKANEISIEMMNSSENLLSLAIERGKYTDSLIKELQQHFELYADTTNYNIICLAGSNIIKDPKISALFKALNNLPVQMVSFGADDNHLLLLVNEVSKERVLRHLHKQLFTNAKGKLPEALLATLA